MHNANNISNNTTFRKDKIPPSRENKEPRIELKYNMDDVEDQ